MRHRAPLFAAFAMLRRARECATLRALAVVTLPAVAAGARAGELTKAVDRPVLQSDDYLQAAAAACVLLALAIAFIALRQAARNRQLASENDVPQIQVDHDPLTGLPNRAHLQARMDAAGEFFDGALFLVDVDHFKRLNDRHGHAAGDRVLVEVARRLESVLRERDLVVRWGGEEFIVRVAALPVAEAVVLAQRMMKALEERPAVVEGQSIGVSGSIGFAVFPLAGKSTGVPFDAACALVDAAMYHSKHQGRRCATCVLSVDPRLELGPASLPAALARAAARGRAILEVHRLTETLVPA